MHLLSRFGRRATALLLLATNRAHAQSVPAPNLDLSSLGDVTIAGNFDAIAVYTSIGQQQGFNTNGTQSIFSALPNGAYNILSSTDASVSAMCPLLSQDGSLSGLVVGGNFTSMGGVPAQSVAILNTTTLQIEPIQGVEGVVSALYCDQDTETVYVGGAFEAQNSSNAIAWTSGGFASLPFAGFDAPVSSITRAPNGHIVFGGSFSGLGNISSTALTNPESQAINLGSANIVAQGNTTNADLGNPRSIVCPSNNSDGSSTFLLADNTPGSWSAQLAFGFEPTKLRLWNTNQEGRGTRTWRYTAHPINGIMNFTYTDPATGQRAFCDARCPLAQNSSEPFQDFFFVNLVGMNSFTIDISDWYGPGGGLDGLELFQNDIFSYAIEAFSDPVCASEGPRSDATATGPWFTTPSRQSVSDYLTAVVGPTTVDSTSIVFEPDVQRSGNYSIVVYTPGCIQDSSCSARAIVNISVSLTADAADPFTTQLFQTNNFDKYDSVYQGYVDAVSPSFRPAVTISPSGLQSDQLIVASRIKFGFISSTGGLNGLFDYDPNSDEIDIDFSQSAINNAGTTLQPNAQILALTTVGDTIYAAGRFQDGVFENIMAFADNNASSLPGGGLNQAVTAMYSTDDFLYVGGNFTNTNEGNVQGLNNIAAYEFSSNSWVALGAGLDGSVEAVVPMQLNVSQGQSETVIAFSGPFNQIQSSGSNPTMLASGLAIWVPSRNAWLGSLDDIPQQALAGQLYAATFLPNGTWLGAGTLRSLGLAISGAAGMSSDDGEMVLTPLPISIEPAPDSSSSRKRAILQSQNITGVTGGAHYTGNGQNVTIFGGHFSASATDGSTIENLMFLNGSNNNQVTGPPTGLDAESTILTVAVAGDFLWAGGNLTGRVDDATIAGLVVYDLTTAAYRAIQPASLEGNDVVVNAIAPQTSTSAIYVGGSFLRTSQDLSCPSVCMYDSATNQWNTVGTGLDGVVSDLYWQNDKTLLATGNLSVSGNDTSLARYDVDEQEWTELSNSAIPGPVSAFAPASEDATEMWVAGTASNGSTFLVQIAQDHSHPVIDAFGPGTTIQGLQVMPLSQQHEATDYLDRDRALLVTGQLNITGFGNAAAALFNGTVMQPLILASTSDGQPGSINQVFSSRPNTQRSNSESCQPFPCYSCTTLTCTFRSRTFKRYRRPRCTLCGTRHDIPSNINRHHPQPNSKAPCWVQDGSQRCLCRQTLEHSPGSPRVFVWQLGL